MNRMFLLSVFLVSFAFILVLPMNVAAQGGGDYSLEIFLDNQLILDENYVKDVKAVSKNPHDGYRVPFTLTEEGSERFASKTGGEAGHLICIYLNRPRNSVLVFKESFIRSIGKEPGIFSKIYYSSESFRISFTMEGPDGVTNSFHLKVPAVVMESGSMAKSFRGYVASSEEPGRADKAIILGSEGDFSEIVENNQLVIENESILPVTYSPKKKGERDLDWILRVSGLESYPRIGSETAGEPLDSLSINFKSEKKAEKVRRTVLGQSGRESKETKERRTGEGENDELPLLWIGVGMGAVATVLVGIAVKKMR